MTTKSKATKAFELYQANKKMPNPDFVTLLEKRLGLTKAAARTYSYNVRNKLVAAAKTSAKKPAAKKRAKKAPASNVTPMKKAA